MYLRPSLTSALRAALRAPNEQEWYIVTQAPAATAPGAPLIGTAVAGYQDATVSFTPTSTGGSPITQYTVTSTPGGITATGASSPIVIPGLTNGQAYTFKVKATNAIGTGPESAASNSVTPNAPTTVPSQPLNVVGTRGNAQASIAFSAPASTGGAAITSYTATVSPGGQNASGAASPLVITGLTNGQSYTATVTATNSVGTSAPSAASAAFVPATVPNAPTIGTATAANAQLTIAFTPGSDNGAAISSYTATATPGGLTASAATSPITIPGLTNGQAYTVKVYATNAVGVSPESAASNSVTPQPPSPTGPFDIYYASDFTLNDTNTFIATPSVSLPAKATGYATTSYTESVLGTRIYRMAQASDMPGADTRFRHEYARRQMFNCDGTKYMLINSADYYFCFDAATFAPIPGHMTLNSNSTGAMGINTAFPRNPGECHWHATDPNKIIYTHSTNGGLTFYEYDISTGNVTTKFSLVGRLGAFGMGSATRVYTGGEGRPSDNGRYWGWAVFNGSTWLGILTYDMQTDTILGGRAQTGTAPNNVTMSPTGNWFNVSSFEGSLSMSQCEAAGLNVQRGSRVYPKDLNSFVQVHASSNHSEMAVDSLGNDVFVGFSYEGSRNTGVTDGTTFYRRIDTGAVTTLFDLYSGAGGGHVSSCNNPGHPGWVVFSTYRSAAESTWRDEMVFLQELKASGAKHLRVAHTLGAWTSGQYWLEPHATVSRDGLKVVWSAGFDGSLNAYAMMAGLPSWAYGDAPTPPPSNPPVNSAVPTISQNVLLLTSTTGSWTNTPTSYAYQWQREDAGPVWTNVGSNSNTHTISDHTKNYRCQVTATNAAGSSSPANSASFDPTDPGSELLTNTTFAADTDWAKGGGWTISGGKANRASSGATSSLTQGESLVAGTTYRFGVTVDSNTGGFAFRFRFTGGTTVQSGEIYSTGYKEVDLVAVSGNNTVELFAAQSGLVAVFDNITLKAYSPEGPGSGSELVSNGGFDSGTGWSTGTGWAIASGLATHSGGTTGNLDQAITLTAGVTYRVKVDVSGYSGSSACTIQFTGGSTVSAQEIRSNGSKHFDIVAVSGNNNLRITGAGSMSFDNISVRAV